VVVLADLTPVLHPDLLHEGHDVVEQVFLVICPFFQWPTVQKSTSNDFPVGAISFPSGPTIGPVMGPVKRAIEQTQPPPAKVRKGWKFASIRPCQRFRGTESYEAPATIQPRHSIADVRDVGPDLQAVRLAADVRSGQVGGRRPLRQDLGSSAWTGFFGRRCSHW